MKSISRTFLRRLTAAVSAPAVLLGLAGAARPAAGFEPAAATNKAVFESATVDRPAAEEVRRLRIMPLGDSITYGVGSPTQDSYRNALYWRLNAVGVPVDYVGSMRSGNSPDPDNEGHKRWTIAQIAEHIDDWLLTYQPDVILLHIGTNDMVQGIADAPEQLDALLDRIAADRPGIQVFVAKIVGLADYLDVGSQQQRTAGYNQAVQRIVAAKGPDFHLVDQSTVHGIDMFNREHPNDYGYLKMAWNWYVAMAKVLNPGGAAWPALGNPYRASSAVRCIERSTLGIAAQGCHTWYHRAYAFWQLPVRSKRLYRVKVGKKTVTQVRVVTRWITAS
jgi:lysophospholipase L1-like esterase